MKKQKENSPESITWSKLGPQILQAKEIYYKQCQDSFIVLAQITKCLTQKTSNDH